jgi:hypothetical protein
MNSIKDDHDSISNPNVKMGVKTLFEIEVLNKEIRLDAAVDYLVKVSLVEDEVYYLAIRLDGNQAIVCYFPSEEKENKLSWISFTKKRTLKATCRLIVTKHPDALSKRSLLFLELNRDDTKARRDLLLSKRLWRVHEVALYEDGYFVARLSCTKAHKHEHTDNQFILYPARFQSLKYRDIKQNTLLNVYSRHGSFSSTLKVPASSIYHALRSKSSWPILSDALKTVEYGYNTEREAKSGYNSIIHSKSNSARLTKYSVRNAVRQHGIDKTLNIDVCDLYQNIREDAWLLKSDGVFFIARMDAYVSGKIALTRTGISTAFTTIEESAKDLISQHQAAGYHGASADEIKQQWKEIIETDFRQRYFIQNLKATWLITHVAMCQGNCVAVKSLCLPEPTATLPFEFQAHTYHILYIDITTSKIVDPSPLQRHFRIFNKASEKFSEDLRQFILKPGIEQRESLIEILTHSRGFTSKNDAELEWTNLSRNWEVLKFDGDACPIPSSFRRQQFEYNTLLQRNDIASRIERSDGDKSSLISFDKRIKEMREFPKALMDLGAMHGVISRKDISSIPLAKNSYRYDLTVDLFEVKKDSDVLITVTNPIIEAVKYNLSDDKPQITTTIKSNAGRKRIHKDDKERKRVWASKNRVAKRQCMLEMGIEPSKPGPNKKYDTTAEKQSAYRFRQKWHKDSINSALIYIGTSGDSLEEVQLATRIINLIPFFTGTKGEQQIIAALPDSKLTNPGNINTIVCQQISSNNVYMISSQNDYVKLKEKLHSMAVERVILCGFSITDTCYRLACYLHENGYQPYLIKHYLHSGDTWEHEVGLKLFRKKFGMKCLL